MNKFYLLLIIVLITAKNTLGLGLYPLIDFDQSMNRTVQYGYHAPDDYRWLEYWKWLYHQWWPFINTPDEHARIPYLIHQIWLGSPFPEQYYALVKSWQLLHPGWTYILWTDPMVEQFGLRNKKMYDAAINYGQKSDLARYEILYEFGGLYADTDFRCLKSFTPLHHAFDFYIGICNTGTIDLAIGLIGCKPHHPILKEVIESAHHIEQLRAYNDILVATGNLHFMKAFLKIAPTLPDRIITLPCSFFYPLPNNARNLTLEQMNAFIKPESFAIHYWECSWQRPQAFVKR